MITFDLSLTRKRQAASHRSGAIRSRQASRLPTVSRRSERRPIEPVAPGETRVLKRLRGGCICFLLSLCEIRTNQEVRNENTAHPGLSIRSGSLAKNRIPFNGRIRLLAAGIAMNQIQFVPRSIPNQVSLILSSRPDLISSMMVLFTSTRRLLWRGKMKA